MAGFRKFHRSHHTEKILILNIIIAQKNWRNYIRKSAVYCAIKNLRIFFIISKLWAVVQVKSGAISATLPYIDKIYYLKLNKI